MKQYLQKSTHAAPLAVFRIALGILLFGSMIRFWAKGWIDDLYIHPKYFFPFYGFEFVQPLGAYTYMVFAICAIAALLIAVGLFYRMACITLFISFTYIELIDKSTYLNHYYFISMVCFLMIFLPAHAYFSLDACRNRKLLSDTIPQWCVDSLKLFATLIYVFAGLTKLNSDWLLHAQPLRIWLPAHNDLPVIGSLLNHVWVAYVFCWLGCLYDLTIAFFLMHDRTRTGAYITVVIFHLLTALLFPIGMFPYIMIATALIFFPAGFHQKIINSLSSWFGFNKTFLSPQHHYHHSKTASFFLIGVFTFFFTIQIVAPFRYLFYPGELFWTEQGYRFSWRVMLMEKAGYAQFTVKDDAGKKIVIDNHEFLSPLQEKMMATQPDMILQYAHLLHDYYTQHGYQNPQVYVDSYVALNGRLGKPMIDPSTDLAKEKESFKHKSWIIPFSDEIKGL